MFINFQKKLIKKIQKLKQPKNIDTSFKKSEFIDIEKKLEKNENVKLKIITSFDTNFLEIGKITAKTISSYSKKYELNHEIIDMPITGRPQSWNKIPLIKEEILKDKNDFIMWVDADAFFLKNSENIRHFLDFEHEIFLVNHYCAIHKGSNYQNTILTANRINCGVMIFKSSEFNIKFLDDIWKKEKYINHPWWEQAAIMDQIGIKAEITGNLNDNKGDENYLKKIKFLNKEWNSIPSYSEISTESLNPNIIHLAGIKNDIRIRILEDYIKNDLI